MHLFFCQKVVGMGNSQHSNGHKGLWPKATPWLYYGEQEKRSAEKTIIDRLEEIDLTR
jgi:hypothetical protein